MDWEGPFAVVRVLVGTVLVLFVGAAILKAAWVILMRW